GIEGQPVVGNGRAARHAARHRPGDRTEDRRLAHGAWPVRIGRRAGRRARYRAVEARPAARPGDAVITRLVTYGWPTLLVAAACVGLAASNVVQPSRLVTVFVVAVAVGIGLLDGRGRVGWMALALAAAALWWGGVRLEHLAHSVLVAHIGQHPHPLV